VPEHQALRLYTSFYKYWLARNRIWSNGSSICYFISLHVQNGCRV